MDRQLYVFGGTSAVALLWVVLLALINQKLGKSVGYLNPCFTNRFPNRGAPRCYQW